MRTFFVNSILYLFNNKFENKRIVSYILGCSIIAISLSGCSNLILPDFEPKTSDHYLIRERGNGMEIVFQPFTDSDENVRLFGVDFLSMGNLPVLLIANNFSDTDSYIIKKSDIKLEINHPDKQFSKDLKTQITGKESELHNAANITVFISPLASLFASVEIQNLQEVKRNLLENEFHTTTVSPGKSKHGFIYITLPDTKIISNHPLVISVDTYNIKTRKTENIKASIGTMNIRIKEDEKI